MNAIFIFGFMLHVAAIRVWKPVIGVDWKTAFHACSANESRLPRVRLKNDRLEVEDHIPLNLSSTFWLGAVYEPLYIDPLNVSVENLGFPGVCCGVFPASDKCIDSCISCHEFHAYKCMVGERSDVEGIGQWIQIMGICLPTGMTRGHKDDKYWTYDVRRLHLDLTTSGQTKSACTYYCAGTVLRGDCSISSGIDAICVSDKVDTSYSSTTSTASTKVSTDAKNSSFGYTDGTLSTTQSITNTEKSTDDAISIHTKMTEGSDDQRSTSQLTSTSIVFSYSTTKSDKDTSTTSSTTSEDPKVFITLVVVMATVLIAFVVVLFMYCRLRKASLKSQKSETNMTDNLSFPDFSRRNPIYGVDHDLVVNGDPHRHVSYSDPDYDTASGVSAFQTGASSIERHLPPGSEEWSDLGGSMNTDTYARPMKVKRARSPSSDEKEKKRENENASRDSVIYATPKKYGKLRKDSKDAERTIVTLDQKTMEPVEDNVSKTMLSGENDETSEGDYDITYCLSRTLGNETPQNLYDTTNVKSSKPSALINTYL